MSYKKVRSTRSGHLFSPVTAETLPPGEFPEYVPVLDRVTVRVEEDLRRLRAGLYASLLKERALLPNDC